MWVTMISNVSLSWNLFLSIFTYCVVAQSVMITGSNFDSTSTKSDVDTNQRKTQSRFTSICGLSTDRCVSVGHAITTSNGATTRQPHLTEYVQTSYNIVAGVTVVNTQSSVMETLGRFSEVDVATATNKMATLLTQIPMHVSQKNNTTRFSGNDSDITRPNNLSIDVYENSTEVSELLRNNYSELVPQSNATQSVTVSIRGNTKILFEEEEYWLERVYLTLGVYVPPFLIIIGTLGNTASVITFQNRHFRSSSTGFILTALSVVDIGVLNTGFMDGWLTLAFGISLRSLTRFYCKVCMVLSYHLHQLASWTLILLTVERTIALWFPLRCKELCSRRRIVIIWVIIAIVLLAEHVFIFVAYDLVPITVGFDDNNITKVVYDCNPIDDYWSHIVYSPWAIVDAVMGDLFPFLVILIGNILTITRIVKSHRERKTQMGAASSTKSMTSTTAMLIGISAMFLILNIPFDGTFIYYFNTERYLLKKKEKAIYDLAYAVGTLCYHSNNAFEFIVYFVSGQRFRQAFLETFLPCRKITNQNVQRTNAWRSTDPIVTSSEI